MSVPQDVSAIVAVHNGARFLCQALASVTAQTRPPNEIIVVDDGSTDGSADIALEHPGVVLVRQPQRGASAARNAGALRARCAVLSFLDHDDIWPPDRNAMLLAAWEANPDASMICGRFRWLAEPGIELDERLRRAEGAIIPYFVGAGMIRRETWWKLGGMDSLRDRAEDVDLYLRLIESGAKVASVDAVTLLYRMHGSNGSRAADVIAASLLTTLRAAVRRRRA